MHHAGEREHQEHRHAEEHMQLEKRLIANGDQTVSVLAYHRGSVGAYEDVLKLLTNGERNYTPQLEPNQMWDCSISIQVGEYEHDEHVYYFGREKDAQMYLTSYLGDIWGTGGETIFNNLDDGYYSKDESRIAYDAGVYLLDGIAAMTEKGTLHYKIDWKLA